MCVQVLAQAIHPLVWDKGLWSTELVNMMHVCEGTGPSHPFPGLG